MRDVMVPVVNEDRRVGSVLLKPGMRTNYGTYVGEDERGLAVEEDRWRWYYDRTVLAVPLDEAVRFGYCE
jgi:hypothetical protein